ncbi:MAG: site-specific integrase [Chloroflexi bacterium]|nr:site-specific integrase [Chloroflexota bacterium]
MSRRGTNEGSIYKRSDGRWVGVIHLGYEGGRRRRKNIYGKTRADVAAKLREAQRMLSVGGTLGRERETVKTLLRKWLKDSAAPKVRPKTLQRYEEIVRLHLIPALGSIKVKNLSAEDVERMQNAALARGVAPRSLTQWRAVLKRALTVAMRWEWVTRNVASLAEPPRTEIYPVRALTIADAQALLAAVKGDRLEALFQVGLALGMRQGETLGLTWEDIDLEGGTLSVRRTLQRIKRAWVFSEPKTARSRRTIPLPEPVARALREHRSRQLEERLRAGPAWEGETWGDLAFPDEIGRPLSAFHVIRRFKALQELAGLPPMRYHDLRHGAASLMAAQGVPPRVAMELLGHSNIQTTLMIYTHVTQDDQREASDKVSAAIWGGS